MVVSEQFVFVKVNDKWDLFSVSLIYTAVRFFSFFFVYQIFLLIKKPLVILHVFRDSEEISTVYHTVLFYIFYKDFQEKLLRQSYLFKTYLSVTTPLCLGAVEKKTKKNKTILLTNFDWLIVFFFNPLALGENFTTLNKAQRVYSLHSEHFRKESHIPFSGTF